MSMLYCELFEDVHNCASWDIGIHVQESFVMGMGIYGGGSSFYVKWENVESYCMISFRVCSYFLVVFWVSWLYGVGVLPNLVYTVFVWLWA